MNRLLVGKSGLAEGMCQSEQAMIIGTLPEEHKEQARKMMSAMAKQNFEEMINIGKGIQRMNPNNAEIMELMGRAYMAQDVLPMAQITFWDLTEAYPQVDRYHMYLGLVFHAQENYKKAVEQFDIIKRTKSYYPFYLGCYGDTLQQLGKKAQARDVFRAEADHFDETGLIVSPEMLDGVFQSLLYLDITLGNQKYPQDIQSYYRFLDKVQMDENMQYNLASNIVFFCEMMKNQHFRPLFREFIGHIREKGYITIDRFVQTLDSAFASAESYAYHEDRTINALLEGYLSTSYDRVYTLPMLQDEEAKKDMQSASLTYEWYMCQYYAGHRNEFVYIAEKYPQTYKLLEAFLEDVRRDPQTVAQRILDSLMPFMTGMTRQQVQEALEATYRQAVQSKKAPVHVYDGNDPYKRMQPKVGRNDPCPCGSGKKYKKCCGK